MEWHLPLPILLYFLYFVFNNNGVVDLVLEVYVVYVVQLELNVIIQSIQEHVLFLFIGVDIFSGASQQLLFARIKFRQHRSAYRLHIKFTFNIKIFPKII
jgi:hypothetical protein